MPAIQKSITPLKVTTFAAAAIIGAQCGGLRDCGQQTNLERTHLQPRPPKEKREPLATHLGKSNHNCGTTALQPTCDPFMCVARGHVPVVWSRVVASFSPSLEHRGPTSFPRLAPSPPITSPSISLIPPCGRRRITGGIWLKFHTV